MQRRTEGDGFVYLVQSTDDKGKSLVKIGYTRAFYSRMGVIEREEYPNEIYVIRKIKVANPVYVEGNLHRKFVHKRVRGEWFNLSKEDVEYAIQLALKLKDITEKRVEKMAEDFNKKEHVKLVRHRRSFT